MQRDQLAAPMPMSLVYATLRGGWRSVNLSMELMTVSSMKN